MVGAVGPDLTHLTRTTACFVANVGCSMVNFQEGMHLVNVNAPDLAILRSRCSKIVFREDAGE
jgi:hypothetical protein